MNIPVKNKFKSNKKPFQFNGIDLYDEYSGFMSKGSLYIKIVLENQNQMNFVFSDVTYLSL